MSALTLADLKVGRVYSAKKPARVGYGYLNDRQIEWISSTGLELQYDGPAVADGRHYPRISVDKFLAWAAADITATMPEDGSWRRE